MEKRGKSKEIALLVLALALVGVLVYTFVPRNPPAPQKPTTTNTTTASKENGARAKKIAITKAHSALPTPESLLKTSPGNSKTRNPFALTPVAPTAKNSEEVKASTPIKTAKTAAQQTNMQTIPVIQGALSPMNGMFPTPIKNTTAVAPVAELRLTGIIVGRPSMAALRKGNSRFYVRVGDRIGSEFVVTSIDHNQVTLKTKEGRRTSLQLGGGARV
jgi:hypothetical protein